MRVRCIANTGKGFSEYTLKHRGCSEETILPFIIGDEYTVYGQLIWKGMLQYLIQGSQEHLPSWYPAEVFEVIDPRLSRSWFFQYDGQSDFSAIWGFKELVFDQNFNDALMEWEDWAIQVFFERKLFMDTEEEDKKEDKGEDKGTVLLS